ncbi:MAG: serine/threonine protein kinase [Acidobacteriota bacterium]
MILAQSTRYWGVNSLLDPLVGKRLREYKILECIGRGGMGKVYKARHVLLDELRAIKLLHPELSQNRESNIRFRREAQILTRIKNRYLVAVYEFGVVGEDHLFMVMEYLQGESLRKRLRRMGWLAADHVIEIAKQVALGLAAAHKHGIVHRDVSPDNIFLVPDETGEVVKIIDFGIAKRFIAPVNGKLTDTMKFVGKAEYSSPEQIERPRDGEDLDGRSDIYSLGVTLYELLTGSRPFKAKTPQGYIAMHLRADPTPFAQQNPAVNISPALADLVMRMLRKNRDSRPESMDKLFLELTTLAHESPLLTPVG